MKKEIIIMCVNVAIILALFVGQFKCIVKACQCNWKPIGKAEIIYTGSAFTGLGAVVGYIDIQDK